MDLQKYKAACVNVDVKRLGRVTQVVGLTIESIGPDVSVGTICHIKKNIHSKDFIQAEVVGFRDSNILLMPLGLLEGVGPDSIVEAQNSPLKIKVGYELLGRVLDGLGEPMDNMPSISSYTEYAVTNRAPDPLARNRISEPLPLGVKVIDGMLTLAKGQRVGIFAGSGVGKSTLLGMITRNTKADINVVALIGERGREVREFIEKDLGEEGLKRSVLVIATSDQPALVRLKAAEVATSIAEFFREEGKDVMLMMDSLTRYSMAQREVGLAVGEPPVSRGYTPSVFAALPKLLERGGNSDKGSISALYTVLVDGDDLTEPVTDTARGILDGHIILSRDIANKNHYPAIDVLGSVSRVMGEVVTPEHKKFANEIRKNMATYREVEDLISVGAYASGNNPEIDRAIELNDSINDFLTQDTEENIPFSDTLAIMRRIANN
ncbi:MAG: flagellar protein export ATPase FliI [Lachnospirales bacterium]